MKTLLVIAALAATQLASAQKTIDIKNFSDLAVSGGVDLTLKKSKENKLVIESGDPDKIKIGTDEGALAISTEGDGNFKVTVYFNGPIEEIALSGGAELHAEGKMKATSMEINIAGGSEVHMAIDTESLSTAIASGAEMHLEGTAKHLEVAVASGAEFNAGSLKTENSDAVVASGAEATIYASDEVNATVASGGELTIHGKPKKVNEIKADGAEIKLIK